MIEAASFSESSVHFYLTNRRVSLILNDDHKERVMGRKCKPSESESHKRDVGVNMILTPI